MARTLMAAIVVLSVPRKELAHDGGDAAAAAFKQQVDVIVHENPGINAAFSFSDIFTQSLQEASLILLVREDWGSVYPAHHDVMQGTRGIEAGLAWHAAIVS